MSRATNKRLHNLEIILRPGPVMVQCEQADGTTCELTVDEFAIAPLTTSFKCLLSSGVNVPEACEVLDLMAVRESMRHGNKSFLDQLDNPRSLFYQENAASKEKLLARVKQLEQMEAQNE